MKPDHLLFLHIPKTAGTTVHNILHRHYSASRQLECNVYIGKGLLDGKTQEQLDRLQLIRGHFPFGLHTHFTSGKTEYCTLLREPVDRCISHYYYIKSRQARNPREGMRKMVWSLEELCANGEFMFIDNLQVRMLSGRKDVAFDQVNEEMMEEAWNHLEQWFPVIGIQEEFDAFVLMLCDRYGFRLPYFRKQRVNEERKGKGEIADSTIRAIAERNRWDTILYERVKTKVTRDIESAGPDLQKRIIRFRKMNNALGTLANLLPFTGKVTRVDD